MKKVWVFLAVTLMLCALTACVDTPTKETYQGGSSLEQSQTKSESFGLNETAVFEKLKITATEIKTSKGDEFFTPEEGKVFVGVKFTVENISSEEQTVSSLMMFEGYVDDVKCDYSFSASCAFDEGTLVEKSSIVKAILSEYCKVAIEASFRLYPIRYNMG